MADRRIRARLAVGAAAVTAAALLAPVASAATPLEYVALGDSSAAGPLIVAQDPDLLCLRSDRNFPHVVATALGAKLTDVTCSGATTADLSAPRFGIIPPQFDALGPDTDLVTLSIGANDMDLGGAVLSCVNLLPVPLGPSCASRFTAGGGDELADRAAATAPKIAAALLEIKRRSPHATVIVTGYGTYTRPGGCFPSVPLHPADADYVQSGFDALSDMLAAQAADSGARFVDLRPVTVGRDMCAAPATRYYEPLVPTSSGVIYHPNAKGMAAFGRLIVDAV